MTSPFLNPPPGYSIYPWNEIKLLTRGQTQRRSVLCDQLTAIEKAAPTHPAKKSKKR